MLNIYSEIIAAGDSKSLLYNLYSYLFFILTLALIPLKISHIIDEDFMEEHFTYLNYTFKLYNGQGSFWKVYKNEIQIL